MGRVLIFGGTTGIGNAIREMLVENNHTTYVIGESQGYDFRTKDGLAQIWKSVRQIEPNIIIYNSGVNTLMPLHELDGDIVEEMYMVNVYGLLIALKEFARVARVVPVTNEGYMRFIHIGSISATVPQTTSTAYCSSKAAARHAVMCAARELGGRAYVNTISPGPVDGTRMTEYVRTAVPYLREWTPEYAEQYQMQAIPLKRRVSINEVVSVVEFLLTSSGITGAEFRVSGGL